MGIGYKIPQTADSRANREFGRTNCRGFGVTKKLIIFF
jgi:hypothetical protein